MYTKIYKLYYAINVNLGAVKTLLFTVDDLRSC